MAIFILVAVFIKIKMPGVPVLVIQRRIGEGGNLFKLYKFRSMYVIHSGASTSIKSENRITKVGVILRK